jgi:hypothetical protein
MTMLKKTIAGASLLAFSALVSASAAFAHDATATEAGHAYTNAEDCTLLDPAHPFGSASETTDEAYPSSGYAADCNPAQGTDSTTLAATAHVLANCSIVEVTNNTADVDLTRGEIAGDPVTSFAFPTQTEAGGVNSDTLAVAVDCNSDWQLDATIDADFAKVGDATEVKGADTFGVDAGALQAFTGAGDTNTLGTYDDAVQVSNGFHFRSGAAPGIEAGDYTGSFTLTVTAVQNA